MMSVRVLTLRDRKKKSERSQRERRASERKDDLFFGVRQQLNGGNCFNLSIYPKLYLQKVYVKINFKGS
jgi:hypothetical protein